MQEEIKYTALPFLSARVATMLFMAFLIAGAVLIIVRAIVYSKSMTLHRAPTSVAFSYAGTLLVCGAVSAVFYWYWALPVCAAVAVAVAFSTAADVREANSEERTGVWGLSKDIRRVRGEIFNDMTPDEQVKYAGSVKEYRFSRVLFMAVVLVAVVAFWFILKISGAGYLFFPVPIE